MANVKSVLLATSAATDVLVSGGEVTITGLKSFRKKDITSVKQIKYKAETKQVVTIGATSYTPGNDTLYQVTVYDPNRRANGFQEAQKTYSYKTPPDVSALGNAAAQREAIHVAIVADINADASNRCVAATSGSGTGFTVTDDGSYYPAKSQSMTNVLGPNLVLPMTNSDGTGFAATNYTVTTAAVLSSGIGANLAAEAVVIDKMFGNLISGNVYDPPLTTAGAGATSGQKYDLFEITLLDPTTVGILTGKIVYQERRVHVWVDNGAGAATTNAAGFVAFEREMLRTILAPYVNDPSSMVDFFDNGLIASYTYPTTGAAITTTDNVVMAAYSGANVWYVNPQSAHTLLTPIISANSTTATSGLQLILDATDEEGMELSAPNTTNSPKQFVVGKQEFSLYGRITFADARHLEEFSIGFREKTNTAATLAYAATLAAYDTAGNDFAVLGNGTEAVTGLQRIMTSLASAGVVSTSTAITYTTNTTHDYYISVDINGLCRFYLDGVEYTSLQSTQFSFAAGAVLIPFIITALDTNVDAAPLLTQIASVPAIWRA